MADMQKCPESGNVASVSDMSYIAHALTPMSSLLLGSSQRFALTEACSW